LAGKHFPLFREEGAGGVTKPLPSSPLPKGGEILAYTYEV